MTTEWDGTEWGGTAAKPDPAPYPTGRPEGMAEAQKATIGPGVGFYGPTSIQLSSSLRSPQALMKAAQQAYRTNPWIRSAEDAVTRRVRGLPWHLEDANGEAYDREKSLPPVVKMAYDLLEKPLGRLDTGERSPSPVTTYDRLIGISSRHLGPCGMAYWFLDQMDGDGIPLNLLYINPARMWDAKDDAGNLVGWVLDPKDAYGHGGTPLKLSEVVPFYLDPPDWGHIGAGLYEAAILKAGITNLADQHASYVLGTGGRIAGIVAPKEGSIPDDKFKILLNEFASLNDRPDAAKRTTIMQGPTDFLKTAADPSELDLIELSKMNRDDVLAIWGVPPSQAAIPGAVGLNSGDTKGYDEAILMQGSVHARVRAISETVQYLLFDRWQNQGTTVTLVIEEPEFDDDTPKYDIAQKARDLPLTNKERRALTGHPPFGDLRDLQVLLPSTITALYEKDGDPEASSPDAATGIPQSPVVASAEPSEVVKEQVEAAGALIRAGFDPQGALRTVGLDPINHLGLLPVTLQSAKASKREFLGLRKAVETRWIPSTQKRVQGVLDIQRREVAAKVRGASQKTLQDNLTRPEYWFATKREDDRMLSAIRPSTVGIAGIVTSRVKELLGDKSAKAFADDVASFISGLTGKRVKGINDTTRAAIADAVAQGVADGLSPAEIGALIEESGTFDTSRAELIARTETMSAYNSAALESYTEYGVEQVQASDGDQDPECAARDGALFSLEEAHGIEDHPNGTLDWLPYFGKAAAPSSAAEPPPATTVPQAPVVVNVEPYRPQSRVVIERHPETGKIVGAYEEAV